MLKAKALPPTQFTLRDALQILFGMIMIPLGLTISYNTVVRGAVVPALLLGCAFVTFGVYRTVFAFSRIRQYYLQKRLEHE